MPRAIATASREFAISRRAIVKHEEVALEPASGIHVDESGLDLPVVVLDRHEKDAIVAYLMVSLVEQIASPSLIFVTVCAVVGLSAPGIAHLHQA